jgi:hypothetical protein
MSVYRAFLMLIRRRRQSALAPAPPAEGAVLLEDGLSYLLLETGDKILLEP